MIDLRRDLYSRMVISAQKNRRLNLMFRSRADDLVVIRKTIPVSMPLPISRSINISHDVNNERYSLPSTKPAPAALIRFPISAIPAPNRSRRIDDKLTEILENPRLLEIKKDLDIAESLLAKIKLSDRNNPKISSIEKTISRIRSLVEQKTYI